MFEDFETCARIDLAEIRADNFADMYAPLTAEEQTQQDKIEAVITEAWILEDENLPF